MLTGCPICDRSGCDKAADGVLAIEFYPPESVMRHYGKRVPLMHLIVGMELCAAHAAEVDPPAFLSEGFERMASLIERASGTAVDRQGAKPVLLAFDDPQVLELREQAEKAGAR